MTVLEIPVPPSDAELAAAYARLQSVWKVAAKFGLSGQSVHKRLQRLGVTKPIRVFSEGEKNRLLSDYQAAADAGELDKLAADMGRTRQFICRQARMLGLTNRSRQRPYWVEPNRDRMKAWLAENDHPRGFAGKNHSEQSREKSRAASAAMWASLSEEQRAALTMKQLKRKVEVHGQLAPLTDGGRSWKAAWREIGGKRKFYRSRWEANYARYLEWLKVRGEIADWQHEPETFWFEKIKRGVRSYLPDFKVTENNGSVAYHEVKGWMDDRSRTTLKRMAKYHPTVRLVLIDAKQYAAISAKVGAMVEGWE